MHTTLEDLTLCDGCHRLDDRLDDGLCPPCREAEANSTQRPATCHNCDGAGILPNRNRCILCGGSGFIV